MKTRQFSKREKLILILTLIVVILGLGYHLFLSVAIDELVELEREIEKKTFLMQKNARLMGQGENLISVYEKYKGLLEEAKDPKEVTAELFETVKKTAGKYRLKVKKVKPLAAKDRKDYQEAILEVDLEGDFKAIYQLINDLENSPLLIKINSLNIRSQAKKTSLLTCRLSLSKVFF